jgi:phosphatidylinositol 4-kinase
VYLTVLISRRHPDPFYVKEEFAPSDRDALFKKQQIAHNLLAPHSRLLQFLGSHFNATRLGSPHTQRIFLRLLRATLNGLEHSTGHPLAREIRFQAVLFGLKVLKYSTGLPAAGSWRLKNQILTAALSWFSFAPRWSFGGNRLQIKAEAQLLYDVAGALHSVSSIGAHAKGAMGSLQAKEELLIQLLENEHARLTVWLFPLNAYSDRSSKAGGAKDPAEVSNSS